MDSNLAAQRAARRFLTERVRIDWDWPNVPEAWSASDEEVRGVAEFRERFYGESAVESEHEASQDANPYQFDSPDAVGDAVELKELRRKRKRRVALEEEMAWNEGLAQFVERRDAWTGAAAVKKYGTNRPAKKMAAEAAQSGQESASDTPPTSLEDSPASSGPNDTVKTSTNAPVPTTNSPAVEPLIPVAPTMLADNHIRATITPRTYPDIYNKIVVSSRTPAVPVNLADMTKALVVGWKEAGEWPPKAAPLDPLVGRKKAVGVNGDEPFLSHHPHMKRGMDSVKRIFHLNGHHNDHDVMNNNG